MALQPELGAQALNETPRRAAATWVFSWPLLSGAFAYFYALHQGKLLLRDGDTFSHIAAGRWMIQHWAVPTIDSFSHTMRGARWTAHEWLSEVILAIAHDVGGWHLVIAVTGLAFAATIALLTRALLRWLDPIYVLLFAGLAVGMTSDHLLARPHILAMPLLMIWTIKVIGATDAKRTPSLWLLPLMVVWANMHGGFTFGLALAGAAALEAVSLAERTQRVAVGLAWCRFIALATLSSLLTPLGVDGLYFTWQVLVGSPYALERIGEWRSPNFHTVSTFELWLLGGFAMALYQGLRLPPVRLLVILGLVHLALKHMRYIELIGVLAPLYIAGPLGAQWKARANGGKDAEGLDRYFRKLANPAGGSALLFAALFALTTTAMVAKLRVVELPKQVAPAAAVEAVLKAGVKGPVLNGYGLGGYLIYRDIPVFIDGRADVYGDEFLKQFVNAMEVRDGDALPQLLEKYGVTWTLLDVGNSAAAVLDHMPEWHRLYADEAVIVHVRSTPAKPANGT